MIYLTLMTLHKSEPQGDVRPLQHSRNLPLTDCIAQVFDNGLCFETTSLIAQIRGYFYSEFLHFLQQLNLFWLQPATSTAL